MSGKTFQRHEIPTAYLQKWQKTVNLARELFETSAVIIRRADGNSMEILVTSQNPDNPFPFMQREDLGGGQYCEQVMVGRSPLTISDASQDARWNDRRGVNRNMLSYYGIPLIWPDRSMFGTLSVLNAQPRTYSDTLKAVLSQFKESIEGDFRIIHYLRALEHRKTELESLVIDRTAELRKSNAQLEQELAERKRMEETLLESKKLESIGRLAGGVAHDFNNMLGVILGCTQISLPKVREGSPLWLNLSSIQKAAERSREITRQLLAFSRKEIITPQATDLNTLIQASEKVLSRLIGEDIRLTVATSPALWIVNIDPAQFDQILMNLSANARDAMPNGGALTIETANIAVDTDYCQAHPNAKIGEYVLVTVQDNGSGMSPETMEHIFEPFYTTKGVGLGTGLGLATVYGVIAQNGGFIEVESMIDHGTTFKIYLPRMAEGTIAVEKPEEPALADIQGSGTILLVEDDDLLLWITTEVLQEMGYHVIQAAEPQEAISICTEGKIPIDLILTDVVMPGMNGKEMVDHLKAQGVHPKVMFMSGYTADIVAQRGILEEGTSFIQKPIDPSELNNKIKRLLHQQ
jgi:two-component system cell cycle sensor histidine kinase/response regulator CckA